jgi:hypothetical protein
VRISAESSTSPLQSWKKFPSPNAAQAPRASCTRIASVIPPAFRRMKTLREISGAPPRTDDRNAAISSNVERRIRLPRSCSKGTQPLSFVVHREHVVELRLRAHDRRGISFPAALAVQNAHAPDIGKRTLDADRAAVVLGEATDQATSSRLDASASAEMNEAGLSLASRIVRQAPAPRTTTRLPRSSSGKRSPFEACE